MRRDDWGTFPADADPDTMARIHRFGAFNAKEQIKELRSAVKKGDYTFVSLVVKGVLRAKKPAKRFAEDNLPRTALNSEINTVTCFKLEAPNETELFDHMMGIVRLPCGHAADMRMQALHGLVGLVREGELSQEILEAGVDGLDRTSRRRNISRTCRELARKAGQEFSEALGEIVRANAVGALNKAVKGGIDLSDAASDLVAKHREFVKGKKPGKKDGQKKPGPLKRNR